MTHYKKDGTPDKRYKENQESSAQTAHLKKDGSPDHRFRENKTAEPVSPTPPSGHLKKDGTPDHRFRENKTAEPESPTGKSSHLRKDGAPDQRFRENKTAEPEESAGGSAKYKPSEHGGLTKDGGIDKRMQSHEPELGHEAHIKKDGAPDMRFRENKTAEPEQSTGRAGSKGPIYKPSEHDGLKKDGSVDKRVLPSHGFGGSSGPDPVTEGRKGGHAVHYT
ncbi:hypothetical protein BT69DRAFT_1317077 [Atractiella rhizophila]|nr:hypothetical protein BT69DRAFT_1317077 [Atractiella rhizophila]